MLPDLSGALLWPADATLLVADLHLEQGTSLARRGLHVPPYDTLATLEQLEAVLKATGARRLVLLGDSFHDSTAHSEIDPAHAARLGAITTGLDVIWLSGNHDPHPPKGFGGTAVDELAIGAITLRHIPARRLAGEHEIAGHLHPGAAVVQRGHRIQAKCFVCDGRRLIMPAFGSYTGGLNIRSGAFGGLLDVANTEVWMLGRSAMHRFTFDQTR